jgi:hypothetical protein
MPYREAPLALRPGRYTVRESMGLSADSSLILAKTMNGIVMGVSTSGDTPEVIWKTDFNIGYDIAPGSDHRA